MGESNLDVVKEKGQTDSYIFTNKIVSDILGPTVSVTAYNCLRGRE
jgi:hypothetical protein